ncbi:MAG: hypothetical protein M9927_01580 [Anaerolineae bacterium]|nr:hypothetical protein [Anaerolineae bacterium]
MTSKPVEVQHESDDVLGDVVDVALNGADDDLAQLSLVDLAIRGLRMSVTEVIILAGQDQFWDEGVALLEALADDVHGLLAGHQDVGVRRPHPAVGW